MTETLQAPPPAAAGSAPKWGVVVFPGSNCDQDTLHVLRDVLGQQARYVWHEETDLSDLDAVILPGGFAHGDYLRAGAVARFSPVMGAIARFAESGKTVVGICNGFQVLLEAGLLPGAMLRNNSQRFACKWVHLRTEPSSSALLGGLRPGQVLHIPVAHGEGNYYAAPEEIARLEERGQIAFRYCAPDGAVSDGINPNGSVGNIAGVTNEQGNVLGMMPHPERASEGVLGSEDGRLLLESVVRTLTRR